MVATREPNLPRVRRARCRPRRLAAPSRVALAIALMAPAAAAAEPAARSGSQIVADRPRTTMM
jgi:hypothetical protein